MGHHHPPRNRVQGCPRLNLPRFVGQLQNAVIDGEVVPLLANVGIDPRAVRLEDGHKFGGCFFVKVYGVLANSVPANGADKFIGGDAGFADDFGRAPLANVPPKFHLPESILGVDKALGKVQICLALGVNMRDAELIPLDDDFAFEASQFDGAIGLGEGSGDEVANVERGRACGQHNEDEEGDEDAPEPFHGVVPWVKVGRGGIRSWLRFTAAIWYFVVL